MGFLDRTVALGLALVAAFAPGGATVANAGTGPSDEVSLLAQGDYYAPGIPTTGCAINPGAQFDGTATFTPDSDEAQASGGPVHFEGTGSACATLAADNGSGTMSGVMSGNVSFTRTNAEVQVSGTVTVSGELHTLTANCELVPTSANPMVTFEIACQAVLKN